MLALHVTPAAKQANTLRMFEYRSPKSGLSGRFFVSLSGMAAKLNDTNLFHYVRDAASSAEATMDTETPLALFMDDLKESLKIVPGIRVESYHC